MAAWKPALSEREIWDVVAYLHGLRDERPEPAP
jgi:mono/diheme cytochrome c family protein